MKKTLFLLIIGFAFASCNSMKHTGDKNLIALTGKIERLGMTTFQYGTHLLRAGTKTYALKSSKVNLDTYIDKQVTLKGIKVVGYPLENGPDLIEVAEVTAK